MDGLTAELRCIVGASRVMTGERATRPFLRGYRGKTGEAAAVVKPGSLVQLWLILQACVSADAIVIMQAANTGLTGGSTPALDGYDRSTIVISTLELDRIYLLKDGRQVLCLPGATLTHLETVLAPLGREPHSVIGSSCIGASVIGGVCNSSGGALVRRGPAFTELALYARVTADRKLELINALAVDLPDDPVAALQRIERGAFVEDEVHEGGAASSAARYAKDVRQIDDTRPARYNADPAGLHGAAGSAGRLCVFAVRLDTFPTDERTRTFYVGTNDPAELATLRRTMLRDHALPVAAEYLGRTAFDIAARYGKDTFFAIQRFGPARVPALARASARFDAVAERVGAGGHVSDRMLQLLSRFLPDHLPRRMWEWRNRYEHHLLLKVADDGIEPTEALLRTVFPSASGDFFACTPAEERAAFLHRFVTAGAAVRYRNVRRRAVEDVVALDVALPRNADQWLEQLPPELSHLIHHALYYGHFFCHVMHQDYLVKRGSDATVVKRELLRLLDRRGAKYPAEHNVGHSYTATPALLDFYRELDPANVMNPGIGGSSRKRGWA